MKPWREIAVPHKDVLEGTFQQSEFAADITAVNTGKATREYQDAVAFFDRTFITEGMSLLLTQVALRLAGKGGEPVVQLQTAFGGGKTHTMLAVYHLATRKCALSDLAGVSPLIDRAGLMDVAQARVAVLDGTAHAPGQAWKRGKQTIKTLWGELAWQLGGADAYAIVKDADATGTSPGKDLLRELLERHSGPCAGGCSSLPNAASSVGAANCPMVLYAVCAPPPRRLTDSVRSVPRFWRWHQRQANYRPSATG